MAPSRLGPTEVLGSATSRLPGLAEQVARRRQEILVEIFTASCLASVTSTCSPNLAGCTDEDGPGRRNQVAQIILEAVRRSRRVEHTPLASGGSKAVVSSPLAAIAGAVRTSTTAPARERAAVLSVLGRVMAADEAAFILPAGEAARAE